MFVQNASMWFCFARNRSRHGRAMLKVSSKLEAWAHSAASADLLLVDLESVTVLHLELFVWLASVFVI